jgi:hypothetical protein
MNRRALFLALLVPARLAPATQDARADELRDAVEHIVGEAPGDLSLGLALAVDVEGELVQASGQGPCDPRCGVPADEAVSFRGDDRAVALVLTAPGVVLRALRLD